MAGPKLDDETLQAAHRQFAADCFNRCWSLIDKADRSPEDDEEMLRLAMASHFHWTQREDYGPVKASVANWQLSRVFALLEQADNARRYAQRALAALDGVEAEPFYAAYACEALARAELVAGDREAASKQVATGRRLAAAVEDAESRKWLEADLDGLAAKL